MEVFASFSCLLGYKAVKQGEIMTKQYQPSLFSRTVTFMQSMLIALLLLSESYAESRVEPQQLMEATSKEMIQAFMAKTDTIRKDPAVAHQLITDNLVPKINFPLMSRWVLGKNWKKATPEQQQEFIKEFKELVVRFYSKALIDYLQSNELSEDLITFMPFRGKVKSKYATVRSKVNPPNGSEPITVNYDLYFSKKAATWQVYDVSVEGISLVTTYRSSFKQIISQKGMDALLDELKNKNSNLKSVGVKPQVAKKS